jgi:serine/threonine-protein kinase
MDDLILKCLAPEPGDRPASADEIKDKLLGILAGAHIHESRKKEAAAGAAGLAEAFIILDIINAHEHGTVYLIKHRTKGQLMVVKRFHHPMAGFKSARLLTDLKHENIAEIFGVSGNRSDYIIVMEYLRGGSLADRLVSPSSWQEGLRVVREIGRGLSFAHKNRVFHGNLSSGNILFSSSGEVKVADFGLNGPDLQNPADPDADTSGLPPETKQTDIVSLGTLFYQILTGSEPVIRKRRLVPDTLFRKQPRKIRRLIKRMLDLGPDHAFQTVDQVLDAMDRVQAKALPVDAMTVTETRTTMDPGTRTSSFFKTRWKWLLPALSLFLAGLAAAGLYTLMPR